MTDYFEPVDEAVCCSNLQADEPQVQTEVLRRHGGVLGCTSPTKHRTRVLRFSPTKAARKCEQYFLNASVLIVITLFCLISRWYLVVDDKTRWSIVVTKPGGECYGKPEEMALGDIAQRCKERVAYRDLPLFFRYRQAVLEDAWTFLAWAWTFWGCVSILIFLASFATGALFLDKLTAAMNFGAYLNVANWTRYPEDDKLRV